MSDKSEQMKPIPDGGLKEAMPSWLKRPPAWRDLPSVEERHERALPEPDTSEIDPHSLVSVDDLPQWLQAIAARGPEAANNESDVAATPEVVTMEPEVSTPSEPDVVQPQVPESEQAAEVAVEPVSETPEQTPETPDQTSPAQAGLPTWAIPVAIVLIALALVGLYFVL